MKTNYVIAASAFTKTSLFLALCAVVPLRAAPVEESNPLLAPRAAANNLQLVVAAPASLHLNGADHVTGVLTHLIETVFQQSGFSGHLIAVPGGEPSQGDIPTLEVYLLDWRITGAGNVDCTFSASLTTANGTTNLGVFDGTSLPMLGLRDAFNRAEAFDQAATDAIDNLYGDLREKNLLAASLID
jgi:hypothetical protein